MCTLVVYYGTITNMFQIQTEEPPAGVGKLEKRSLTEKTVFAFLQLMQHLDHMYTISQRRKFLK